MKLLNAYIKKEHKGSSIESLCARRNAYCVQHKH